jgi:hypothetical protein
VTIEQLSFRRLPTIAGGEGDTAPVPGPVNGSGGGVWAWSATLGVPVYWNGVKWTAGNTGGGGGTTILSTFANFPTAQYAHATHLTGVTDVKPTSKVNAWLVPNFDWDADDLVGYSVTAVAGSGAITFTISGTGPIVGAFDINYFWS